MNDLAPLPPITGTVSLAMPMQRAFALFTAGIDTWWPHQFHIGSAEVAEIVLEPHVGGRWFERGVDGSECDWGRVLVWEPPHRVVFTWQITGSWVFDPDPDRASEIDARFRDDLHGHSVVEVEHRLFERLDGGRTIRDAINGGGGWALLLEGLAAAAKDERR
jgi:uncharacterized protein YndB with AHSA1/START domain